MDQEALEKFPEESDSNVTVQFFNYNSMIGVVNISRITDFPSNIRLIKQVGQLSELIVKAAVEARSWIIQNGSASQRKAVLHGVHFKNVWGKYGDCNGTGIAADDTRKQEEGGVEAKQVKKAKAAKEPRRKQKKTEELRPRRRDSDCEHEPQYTTLDCGNEPDSPRFNGLTQTPTSALKRHVSAPAPTAAPPPAAADGNAQKATTATQKKMGKRTNEQRKAKGNASRQWRWGWR